MWPLRGCSDGCAGQGQPFVLRQPGHQVEGLDRLAGGSLAQIVDCGQHFDLAGPAVGKDRQIGSAVVVVIRVAVKTNVALNQITLEAVGR